jgi:GDPmannose 4,6-dehydratase
VKRALITGIFGQDGSYLAELLAGMGYEVHGVARASASAHSQMLGEHLARKGVVPTVHECDLLAYSQVAALMRSVQPAECYHLAAIHYSAQMSAAEQLRIDRDLFAHNTFSTLNLLSAIQEWAPGARFVLAGSCMMYDDSRSAPQAEKQPFRSRSMYGLSKIAASELTDFFRVEHGLHASTAILYNHESPRRRPAFVTRKIVQGMVRVKRRQQPCLELGNLHAVKDWGYARDYVRGMTLMAQAAVPRSYILATGRGHTIGEFVQATADALEMADWSEVVRVEAGLTRQPEPMPLIGDPAAVQADLGWGHSLGFRELVELMVEHELQGTLD